MSKAKSISALAGSLAILAVSCWFVTGEFRLQAAPQVVADSPGVGVDTNFESSVAQLLHRAGVFYPDEAIAKGVQGTVVVQIRLDAEGNVSDATVVSGPDELRKAVLQSVLDWHFVKDVAGTTRQVSVSFALPKAAAAQIEVRATSPRPPDSVAKSIEIHGLSDAASQQLLAQLPARVGDTITPEKLSEIVSTVHAFDSHLTVRSVVVAQGETAILISLNEFKEEHDRRIAYANERFSVDVLRKEQANVAPPQVKPELPDALRVAGEAQKASLVTQAPVVYPPLAKAAHVQGTVVLAATIGRDGSVQNLQLVFGPPLLVKAAMDSVNQWVYRPTIVNGNPVAVTTTIDVYFTLAE